MPENKNGWVLIQNNGETHVVPMNDVQEHHFEDCTCGAYELTDSPGIFVHCAFDERDKFEKGQRKVS